MAVDKLVDSTQLDADLTSVANAIRTKGGTSTQLAFPAGFVSAVEAIPTGGGGDITADEIASHTLKDITITLQIIPTNGYSFYSQDIETIQAPNLVVLGGVANFSYCRKLKSIIFPELTTISSGSNFQYAGAASLATTQCILVFPKLALGSVRATFDRGCFLAIDIGPNTKNLYNDTFYHNSGLQTVGTLILRRTAGVVTASTQGAINGLRDVYVPSALISQYEAATNWSTRVSGGYITFHAIEGSQYENAYADGTPIT